MILQPDGKIIAPLLNSPHKILHSFVYNPNGSLDPTFGSGGKVTTDFFGQTNFFLYKKANRSVRLFLFSLNQTATFVPARKATLVSFPISLMSCVVSELQKCEPGIRLALLEYARMEAKNGS